MSINYTEFHIHTSASHDSLMGRYALLAMCKRKKVNCIAITDHNEIKNALEFKPWLEARGVSVIVGEEIFTTEGEIIGMWLSGCIESNLTPEETVRQIREQGGAVCIPHPYDEKRSKTVLSLEALLRIAPDIDCVEVHNGRNVKLDFDNKQEEMYKRVLEINPLARKIIGCDAHCFFEIGRNTVSTDEPVTRDNFPGCLDNAVFNSSLCHPLAHRATRFTRLVKLIARGDFRGIYRIFARKLS